MEQRESWESFILDIYVCRLKVAVAISELEELIGLLQNS